MDQKERRYKLHPHFKIMILSFANAIQMALIPGVPCALPYSDVNLLQIIRSGQLEKQGPIFRRRHVLVNPGNNAETLLTCFSDDFLAVGGNSSDDCRKNKEEVLKDLQGVIDQGGTTKVMPMQVTWDSSKTSGIYVSHALEVALASVGYNLVHDRSWSLSIDGKVTKKSVAVTKLENILMRSHINWVTNIIGVVTAIYVITGDFSFTEKVEGTSKAAVEFLPNDTNVSIAGWTGDVTGSTIHLKKDDPVDWVVAVEYLRLDAVPKGITGVMHGGNAIKADGQLMAAVGHVMTSVGDVVEPLGDVDVLGDSEVFNITQVFVDLGEADFDDAYLTQDYFDLRGVNFAPLDVALPLLTYEERRPVDHHEKSG